MDKDKQEVCSIRIMFPTNSDEQSIGIKTKIKDVLSGIQDVQFNFSITDITYGENLRRTDRDNSH